MSQESQRHAGLRQDDDDGGSVWRRPLSWRWRRCRRLAFLLFLTLPWTGGASAIAREPPERPWGEIAQAARGQTVFFHAWAGDRKVNAYIRWAGEQLARRHDIILRHVKTSDTGEVVALLLAEKAAGRMRGGRVDLVWINGENFHALKEAGLLFGPFAGRLPNFALVDTDGKPATVIDFALPTEGFEAPWGHSQLTFFYDSARIDAPPRSTEELLGWAKSHPGRFTYPAPPDFLGTSFLKQILFEHTDKRELFERAPSDREFAAVTAALWAYLDALHPLLWRRGRTFPPSGPALRQLMADAEIDLAFSFNPADASSAIAQGLLPKSVRAYILEDGTIANAHFVAIPFNAEAKEAAMVTANFLLSPEAQAKKADPAMWGDPTVLDLDALRAEQRRAFEALSFPQAYPAREGLERRLPEPHPAWVDRLERAWKTRYGR